MHRFKKINCLSLCLVLFVLMVVVVSPAFAKDKKDSKDLVFAAGTSRFNQKAHSPAAPMNTSG